MIILTKPDFWDDVEKRFPKATQLFYKWLDEYKINNNLQRLFNPNYKLAPLPTRGQEIQGKNDWPKFHDLPMAMQAGIFLQFIAESDENIIGEIQIAQAFKIKIRSDMEKIESQLL